LATLLSEVADLFFSRISDYRLNTINTVSGSMVLNVYVEPWLLDSIVEFDVCDQVLNYTPSTGSAVEGSFSLDLSLENKLMLSQMMVKYWLAKEISDVLQMQNFVTDKDFKTFSSAQNLKAKQDYYNTKREEISQLIVNYGYKKNDWADWRNQTFYK
jgi:hypothetical protein